MVRAPALLVTLLVLLAGIALSGCIQDPPPRRSMLVQMEAPRWETGDTWEYHSGGQDHSVLVVTVVSDGIPCPHANGTCYQIGTSTAGVETTSFLAEDTFLLHEPGHPVRPWLDFPLSTGKTWEEGTRECTVGAAQMLDVPAGWFATLPVTCRERDTPGEGEVRYYSAETRNLVRITRLDHGLEQPGFELVRAEPSRGIPILATAEGDSWVFTYPDGSREQGRLRVAAGRTVDLRVTSAAGTHSFQVPDLGIRAEATPDRAARVQFPTGAPGVWRITGCPAPCTEGAPLLNASLEVFPRADQPHPWGPAPEVPFDPEAPMPDADVHLTVTFTHSPGDTHGPWSISPSRIEVGQGQKVSLRLVNNETAPHNLSIGGAYNLYSYVVGSGKTGWLNFTAAHAGTFPYWCHLPGHRGLGMEGVLTVREG